MKQITVNSDSSLSQAIGELRNLYTAHRYVRVKLSTGKARSLDQNAISHAWYQQIADELREDTPNEVKRFCKLHVGVPILRAEDDDFREQYDSTVKLLPYEAKLRVMDWMPVTSLMTKQQLSQYLEGMQATFAPRGVLLEFPKCE